MTTAYTQIVEDTDCTFEAFVMRCTRAFGYLIHMREMPWDAPIPEKIEPDPFYSKRAEETQATLVEVYARNTDAWKAVYTKYCQELEEYSQPPTGTRAQKEKRVRDMLEKVQAWRPDKKFDRLKEFMIEQLSGGLPATRPPPVLVPETFEEFVADSTRRARDNVEYYAKKWKESIDGAAEATAWLTELRATLKKEVEP